MVILLATPLLAVSVTHGSIQPAGTSHSRIAYSIGPDDNDPDGD